MKNNLKKIDNIEVGKIYLGKFKNEFFRCKVTQKKKDLYEVLFIDFGNTELLKSENMRVCPDQFSSIRAFAFHSKMDYIKIPPSTHFLGEDAFDFFDEWAGENELRMVQTRSGK